MARRELGPAALAVVQAVQPVLSGHSGAVVVACSGGADSMALAAALAHLAGRGATLAERASARIIDHGLQPGSAEVAAQVATRLGGLGLQAQVRRVQVLDDPAGMEAAARTARYAALAADLAFGSLVLLGHTMDDQAETVLLGLARGSGTRSLAGMPARYSLDGVDFARPLLGLRREVTERACQEWGLPVWYDPHNQDRRFTRVRVRTSVLPTLEAELGPGITEALARTADLARSDADELDAQAARLLDSDAESLEVAALAELPDALASRVLRRWLVARGVPEPSLAHLRAVRTLVDDWHGQAGVDLPGGVRVRRAEGRLFAGSTPPASGGQAG